MPPLPRLNTIARTRDRLHALLWEPLPHAGRLLRALTVPARFVWALARDLASGHLTLRAMSLVYTTLMSLVPLLAFSFSLLKGAGVHRQMDYLLLNFLDPLGEERAQELTEQILTFVDNLQGTLLGGVGLVFLIFVVISMVQKVEGSMNWIWRVGAPRSLARRFTEYLSVMLLGPLMMALAVGLTATVSSHAAVQRLLEIEPFGTTLVAAGQVLPYAILALAFTLLYRFVPNTRVRWSAALVGGVFGGVAWAAASAVFAQVVVLATRIAAVYSSFAIVIFALIWVYLSWLILLLGAQLAYYVQHPEQLRDGREARPLSVRARERVGLAVALLVARSFMRGERPWHPDTLAARFGLPQDTLLPVLEALKSAGLLVSGADGRLLPARSPDAMTVADVLHAIHGDERAWPGHTDRWTRLAQELCDRADSALQSSLSGTTLAAAVTDGPQAADTGPVGRH